MWRLFLTAALAATLASCASAPEEAAEPPDPTLRTVTGGQIQGVDLGDVLAFKGIPFAAPPVGINRWRDPQPVVAWQGVRAATEFAPACKQAVLFLGDVKDSEDCLYLNVWRPDSVGHEPLPVMVWIHGGSFAFGYTQLFDPAVLVRRGVIVVSLAYRLNIFGFLAHPELSAESGHGSGNSGLLDQIAALQWVRENIAAFGGDPRQVTLFGESSGGHSVSMLAACPLARGLFHRAISQSGGGGFAPAQRAPGEFGMMMARLPDAERAGVAALRALGAGTLAEARALGADRLLQTTGIFWPVVDRHIIVADQYELYRQGRYNDTPVLIGTNADEGSIIVPEITSAGFTGLMKGFGDHADEMLAVYPHATDAERLASARNLVRDAFFGWPTWTWVRLQSRNSNSGAVYAYYFDYDVPNPANPALAGPIHGAEIPYVFGALSHPNDEQAALAAVMTSYWVNFARTGNPNGPGLPQWPAFEPGSQQMMRLNAAPAAGPTPNLPQLQAMDDYFAWRRSQH